MKTLGTILLAVLFGLWGAGCILPGVPQGLEDDDDDSQADDDDSQADDDDSQADDDDSQADDDDSQTDDDDDSQSDDDTFEDDTDIRDIQQGNVPEDTEVQVNHVVVTSQLSANPPYVFFVQEPGIPADAAFSGIYVYVENEAIVPTIQPSIQVGNTVDITAMYLEYYELSELKIDEATDVVETGTFQINPAVVDPCDVATGGALQEDYEGVLVRVGNVSVTDDNPDDPQDFGEFEVAACLRVDDLFHQENPEPGTAYQSISGVMNYAYNEAKLEPRGSTDLVPY